MLMLVLSVWGCSLLEREPDRRGRDAAVDVAHDMIVLGDKLDDPYSIDNVKEALAMLYPTRAGRMAVKPTDIYVRFLPASEDQYERLVSMELNLIDHPLDYQILKEGDYYHDPSLDEDVITWQYAVVKPDFVFPSGIKYEILDECYIPEGGTSTKSDGIDWEAVEREAFVLTGNSGLLAPEVRAGVSSGVAPSGRICLVDDRVDGDGVEGLAGVKVSCNTFVKFAHAYTDADGCYEMKTKFSSDLRYRIVFQNEKGFAIGLNKILVPASSSTLGANPPEGVSLTIDGSSDRRMFCRAVVNNAAYQYFDKCAEHGVRVVAPPVNTRLWIFQLLESSSAPMLQQGVLVDEQAIGQFLGDYKGLVKMFLPDITLGVRDLENYSSIYAQTVHELAHGSHFSQVGKDFWNRYIRYVMLSYIETGGRMYGLGTGIDAGYCEVGEMWAYYMQNRMYKDRYGEDNPTFGTSYWFQPHILLYMDERGVDRSKIFRALTPSVISRSDLHNELDSLYPEFQIIIDQAFQRYAEDN